MTDKFTKEKRSEIMSKIRGKDTSIELKVRSYLHANGFRFRVNDRRYPGTPDIVLPKYKTIIFVNGCFWHGHRCKYSRIPHSNIDFWTEKINKNIARDEKVKESLTKMGWSVIVVWECELENEYENTMSRIRFFLENNSMT